MKSETLNHAVILRNAVQVLDFVQSFFFTVFSMSHGLEK